jgi:hypothetical protein
MSTSVTNSNSKNDYKYSCKKCDFHTNAKSSYDKHLMSGKHITGERAIRCDKRILDKCPSCDYTTKNITNMERHVLNNHSSKEERKQKFKYYCEMCDHGTFGKSLHQKHLDSEKHKLVEGFALKSNAK